MTIYGRNMMCYFKILYKTIIIPWSGWYLQFNQDCDTSIVIALMGIYIYDLSMKSRMLTPLDMVATDKRNHLQNIFLALQPQQFHLKPHSGILIMGVRLTSHWTAATFTPPPPDENEWVNALCPCLQSIWCCPLCRTFYNYLFKPDLCPLYTG
jgi:hypothetical protein